ncbi:MAG: AAA family ATPase, partial [Bacillota bacterium]
MIKEIIIGIIISVLIILYVNGLNILPFIFIGVALYFLNYLLKDNKLIKNTNNTNKVILDTNFSEIGGQESAKNELKEALDFLNNTNKIKKLGIRPLKGILLEGPPGTGKTLMAKAAAKYTDSTFTGVSGSEFIEMYAGVGAKRIRE